MNKKINDIHIGNQLKKFFKKRKIVVSELAKKLEYTRVHIYNMYKYEDVNTQLLKKIANELNTSFIDIITDCGTNIQTQDSIVMNGNNNITVNEIQLNQYKIKTEEQGREIDLLKQIIEAKNETIEALKKNMG